MIITVLVDYISRFYLMQYTLTTLTKNDQLSRLVIETTHFEQKRTENSGYGIELVLFDARYGKKATLELRVIDQFSKADKHRSLNWY